MHSTYSLIANDYMCASLSEVRVVASGEEDGAEREQARNGVPPSADDGVAQVK